jgi:hypothetical protein
MKVRAMPNRRQPSPASCLKKLGKQFDDLAQKTAGVLKPADKPVSVWDAPEPDLLRRHAIHRLVGRFEELVRGVSEYVISLHALNQIRADGLAELVAANELGEWGGLVSDPLNFFAALAGWPLVGRRGRRVGDALNPGERTGAPVLVKLGPFKVGVVGDDVPPDADQCRHYAKFCRKLASTVRPQKGGPTSKSPGMSKDEANRQARDLLKSKKKWTQRELAKAIGCAVGQVCELPAYKAWRDEHKPKGDKAPKAIPATDKVLASVGKEDAELERLIAEQEKDLVDSPLISNARKQSRRPKV